METRNLNFTLTEPAERRPWKTVRSTSKAVYALGREMFRGRKANVLRWLAAYWNHYNESPTSAEVAGWGQDEFPAESWDWVLLYTRRGISDLHKTGIIEHVPNGARLCRGSRKVCETWRVREVGSEESR